MNWKLLVVTAAVALGTAACSSDSGSDNDGDTPDAGSGEDTGGGDGSGDPGPFDPMSCDPHPDRCDALGTDRPTRRSEHGAAYVESTLEMVVFGGQTAIPIECGFPASEFVDETWIFDDPCGAWTLVDTPGPSPRGRHMMTASGDAVWVFGGRWRSFGAESGTYTLYDDLWRFDIASRTWELVDGGGGPDARINGVLEYDASRDVIWLMGGNTSASGGSYFPQNDVWSFDIASGTWTEHTISGDAPEPRLFHTGIVDASRDQLVITGGSDDSAFTGVVFYYDDVWALDLDSLTWSEIHDGGSDAPDGRFWGRWVHDLEQDVYVLFAGHDATDVGNRNDSWEFVPGDDAWFPLATGDTANNLEDVGFCDFPADFTTVDTALPERRNAHTFVWSATCGHGLTFGGKTDCGASDDLWRYVDARWENPVVATEGEVCHRFRNNPDNCISLCL